MRNLIYLLVVCCCTIFPYCSITKKAAPSADAVSYAGDIAPMIQAHCAPCHFPDRGKVKFLDTYASARNNIDEMIARVQLPADNEEFMPFKSKRDPLSESQIATLIKWKSQGMAK